MGPQQDAGQQKQEVMQDRRVGSWPVHALWVSMCKNLLAIFKDVIEGHI